jgi:hypothetical protein
MRDKTSNPLLKCALTMLISGALLLVVAMFIPSNHGMEVVGLSALVITTALVLLLWRSKRDLRQVMRYLLSIVFSVFSFWASINFLNWRSAVKYGNIGIGGGFSVAIGSIFLSSFLCVFLLLSLAIVQEIRDRKDSKFIWARYVPLFVVLFWFFVILVWGFKT